MEQNKHILKISGPLKWLAKSILVFGLIAFSGHAYEVRFSSFAPNKTELSEVRNATFKRTFNLEKVFNGTHSPLSPAIDQPKNFVSLLNCEGNRVRVKLKSIFKELPINEQHRFLIYFATNSAEAFDTNYTLG